RRACTSGPEPSRTAAGSPRHLLAAAGGAAALALAEAPPYAVPLAGGERVVQALLPHLASTADDLRLACLAAVVGVEHPGVGLRAQRAIHPCQTHHRPPPRCGARRRPR